MMKKVFVLFTGMATAVAFAASSYHVKLFSESTIGGKSLQAGEYKLELNDSSVVLKGGKEQVEAPATTETSDKKFSTTTVRYNDQHEIQEIRLGGTNKKIVLNSATSGTATKSTIQ